VHAGGAETVARYICETGMGLINYVVRINYEVKDVQSNVDGAWTVFLCWGAVYPNGELEPHGHTTIMFT